MTLALTLIEQAPAALPVPFPSWNPFSPLGSAAGKVVADGWTAIMLAIWNCGSWLLRLALHIIDQFMTPDLREDGPGRPVYELSLWLGMTLFIAMSSVQLGVSAFQRNGRGLARVLIGYAQFVGVWAAFNAYALVVIAAVQGITAAILSQLLHIDSWAKFEPLGTRLDAQDVTEGSVATVMGVLGVVLVIAAFGHIMVMIARSGSLMVLVSTSAISAGGLGSEVGKSWFWKTFRWFHAAAFTPVIMALLLGLGVSFTAGVATGQEAGIQRAVGTAVPSVLLVLIAAFSPLALYKLLAFTDPNTNSGASMRAGLAAAGGISGLLGAGGGAGKGSGAASSVDGQGRSQAEANGQGDSEGRMAGALKKLGPVGSALGSAIGTAAGIGAKAASLGADMTNQMGVGHGQYVPDFGGSRGRSSGGEDKQAASGGKHGDSSNEQGTPSGPADPSGAAQQMPGAGEGKGESSSTPSVPTPPTPEGMPGMPSGGQGGGQGQGDSPSPSTPGAPSGGEGQGGSPSTPSVPTPPTPEGMPGMPSGDQGGGQGQGGGPSTPNVPTPPGGAGGAGGAGAGGAAAGTPPPVV